MQPVLTATDLTKTYPGVKALDSVSMDVFPGEVHAVIGENGAGKSTLMAVLSGFVTPDSGFGTLNDKPLPFGNAAEVRAEGVELVHQHFMLVRNFRVDENLALSENAPLNLKSTARKVGALAKSLGWEIDFTARIAQLPVGAQQRVEILKALSNDPKVLILDEPTAVLGPDEVANLIEVLRRLRDKGVAVVIIAHKIAEVMAAADRITVLRMGKVVGSVEATQTDEATLAAMMVGEAPPQRFIGERSVGEALLTVAHIVVRGDRGNTAVDGATFTVRSGEILGIGGVDGNGQVELAEALAAVRAPLSGSIERQGELAYIPQDRRSHGLAVSLSIKDNLVVGAANNPSFSRGPLLDWKKLSAWSENLVKQFQVKAPSAETPVSSLSGGNQQKVVVARELSRSPMVLIAVNPTRGLDIRAADFVHSQIQGAADRGAAVVLISTDADELALLASRTLYMSKGNLSETLEGSLR